MGDIQAIADVNLLQWIIVGFIIIFAVNKSIEAIGKFANHIGKPIKWIKTQNLDHELIMENTKAIKELAEIHKRDNELSDEHDDEIKKQFSAFMREIKNDIKTFTNNRIHDREQSLAIQKELTDSIKNIVDNNATRDKQIENLMRAQREVLANQINEKYKHYINLQGIPEDELDEFINLHTAYKGCGGNSSGDAKFEYCIKHLSVIPAVRKLIIKHDE